MGFIKKFLITLGIVFLVIIVIVVGLVIYLVKTNPFGIEFSLPKSSDDKVEEQQVYDHPLLSPEQEDTLTNYGVDVSTLPAQITPEQESCAVGSLGQERVDEIKSGSAPSVTDYFKAKNCFE